MAGDAQEVRCGFPEGAVWLVRESGKPISQVAGGLGINKGTLGTERTPTGAAAAGRSAR